MKKQTNALLVTLVCASIKQIAEVGGNVTSFSNTGLSGLRFYTYRVQAFNSAGHSGYF